jgi:hypothetical protein
MGVAGLLLDEQRVPAGLDQVGDVGAAQRGECQEDCAGGDRNQCFRRSQGVT